MNVDIEDKNFPYITVHLHDGLGNRLHSIATAYALSRDHNVPFKIFKEYIADNKHSKKSYTRFYKQFLEYNGEKNKSKLYLYILPLGANPKFKKINHSVRLWGFFENCHNYIRYRDDLIKMFEPSNDEEKYLFSKYPYLQDSYFLHVRLGDMKRFWDPYNIDLNNYYVQAVEQLDPDINVYLFTNDYEECVKLYPQFLQFTYVDEDEIMSLFAMSLCGRGGILPNSTFSWWASFLNKNSDSHFIMPSVWSNYRFFPESLFFDPSRITIIQVNRRWVRFFIFPIIIFAILIILIIFIVKYFILLKKI